MKQRLAFVKLNDGKFVLGVVTRLSRSKRHASIRYEGRSDEQTFRQTRNKHSGCYRNKVGLAWIDGLTTARCPFDLSPSRIGEELDRLRRLVAGGIDVLEMRRLAAADLKAQGVLWA